MRKRSLEDIRKDFEAAKSTGDLREIETLRDELFGMRLGSRGGLVVNGENTALQRGITDLVTEMDCYLEDLKDATFEERDLVEESGEMEY